MDIWPPHFYTSHAHDPTWSCTSTHAHTPPPHGNLLILALLCKTTQIQAVFCGSQSPSLFPGIIRESEGIYNLKNPTLFIFAENDAVIPLEQVSGQPNSIS